MLNSEHCPIHLEPFIGLIREKSGLYFKDENISILENAIKQRISSTGKKSMNNYFCWIQGNEVELSCLIDILTINETYFFREPQHFSLLSGRLFPELLNRLKGDEKIKILSAGCATGEEPYSILMCLIDKYGFGILDKVKVIGADIDSTVLKKARKGVYGTNSFRGRTKYIPADYFLKIGPQQYEVVESIRKKVEFIRLNMASNAYPGEIYNTDIIFYRNVSIYFNPDTQRDILRKLSGLLSRGGYLFVSSTETYSHNIGVLFQVEMDGVFLYRHGIEAGIGDRRSIKPVNGNITFKKLPKKVSGSKLPYKRPTAESRKPKEETTKKQERASFKEERKSDSTLFDETLEFAKIKDYKAALGKIDELLEYKPHSSGAHTLKASMLLNLGLMDEAQSACKTAMEYDEWSLEAYMLMGIIGKSRSDDEEALKNFKSAIYIKQSCWLAHFYIAEINSARGNPGAARKEYGITMRLIKKHGIEDNGLVYFPLAFAAEQVIHLCKINLEKHSHV